MSTIELPLDMICDRKPIQIGKVGDLGIARRAEHAVSLFKQQFGKIGTVLTRYAANQCRFHAAEALSTLRSAYNPLQAIAKILVREKSKPIGYLPRPAERPADGCLQRFAIVGISELTQALR